MIDKNNNQINQNDVLLNDFLRCLTMLEKALERIARQNYHRRTEYPKLFF